MCVSSKIQMLKLIGNCDDGLRSASQAGQMLRALAGFVEDLGSVSSSHITTVWNSTSRGSHDPFWKLSTLYTPTHRQTLIHRKIQFKKAAASLWGSEVKTAPLEWDALCSLRDLTEGVHSLPVAFCHMKNINKTSIRYWCLLRRPSLQNCETLLFFTRYPLAQDKTIYALKRIYLRTCTHYITLSTKWTWEQ